MNQEQIKEEKSSILTLLLSSILLHMLLILAIIFYRLAPDMTSEKIKISQDDKVVLWTSPSQKMIQSPAPIPKIEPKKVEEKQKEEKQQEPDDNFLKKAPIITPGRQGIDEQFTSGANIPIETTDKKIQEEERKIPEPKPYEPKKIVEEKIEKEIPLESRVIKEDKFSQTVTNSKEQSKQPLKFDTNLPIFHKAKSTQYQHVPQVIQKSSVKSISFKDISLGFNNAATNIGNSMHLMIQGTSPDIPQGDELKYITFLNQMANMIVTSIHTNPKVSLVPRAAHEKIICFMKINRSGQLLDTRIISPSMHEIINIVIIDSIKNVGLFNPIPKFIAKDTFEINWHILT